MKNEYLKDLKADNYDLTVSYNPYRENYVEANGNQAPQSTEIHLTVVKAEGSITDIADISQTYTGLAVEAPSFTTPATAPVTYEYKLKDSEDSSYTTEAPVNAGTYVVRITVGTDEYYKEVSEEKEFTIAPAKVTVKANDASSVYSKPDAELTYEAEGVIEGTPLTDITVSRTEGENAGTYDIIASQEEGSNPNYEITFEKGIYTIEPLNLENLKVSLDNALSYNGKEQEQLVKEVRLEDGTIVPTDGYTVEGNKATEAGVYTLTIKGTGNYTGEFETTYVMAPTRADQIREDENGNVVIGNGTLAPRVEKEGNAPEIKLVTGKADIIAMLVESGDITADEMVEIANGAQVDIVIKVKDASASISAESKAQMEKAASSKGYVIGQYIDISLYKYMTVGGATDDGTQIHNTAGKIKVSVQIPEKLLNKDSSVKRTYYILRNHDGVVDVIDGTYDDSTQMFTFETDKFSDYAIAYTDTKINTPKGTTNAGTTAKAPKTGDSSQMAVWFVVVFCAAGTMIVAERKRRKQQ